VSLRPPFPIAKAELKGTGNPGDKNGMIYYRNLNSVS